jgi:hypothetical protein
LLKSRLQPQQAKSSERRADRKAERQQRIHLKPPAITTQDPDEKFTAAPDNVASANSEALWQQPLRLGRALTNGMFHSWMGHD